MSLNLNIQKKESGFTLIETMIVVAILAILAGVAIPGFIQWMPNYSLKSAAQDIYSDLQLAKMEAVRANAPRSIVFHAGSNSYTKADGTDVILTEYEYGIEYGNGNATETVQEESFSGDYITYSTPDDEAEFNSRGMANNSGPGYVYIKNNKGTAYAVGSLPSGVIQIKKWDDSSGWQ